MKYFFISLITFFTHCLSATEVKFGGFVDTYYAYDVNHPASQDRDYTTQAVRNNEFNINLAYIDAKITGDRIRGRFALQTGTSVQSNYAGEPTIGSNSGSSISRFIQEGYAGYQVTPNWWIDAGIMLSHIGMESWISKDNLTYLRSLVADYSPYYQAGIRNEIKINDKWSAQILILNGWQNISENNSSKSIGMQLNYTPTSSLSFIYNNFIGHENGLRHFHDFIVKANVSDFYTCGAQVDVGFQETNSQNHQWYGFSFINSFNLSPLVALNLRGEYYSDPHQAIINTQSSAPFKVWGASIGIDYKPIKNLLYRFETRSLLAQDAIFQSKSGNKSNQTVLALSMGLTF